ncbi:MAG: hypothetical protein KIA08_04945 [Clostridium baratii]|uniref:hypothetical protein n=1 Tax=Clostridium baratii TaxID=1561 RepID=UPI00242DF917|nr:hypothetical protein [Clostridium baratii]MBS6042019.1 hypothetical protein [Clostridium baratii]
MWSKKTHKICDRVSLILVLLLGSVIIGFLLDKGVIGMLLALVIASIFIRILLYYFGQKIISLIKSKNLNKNTTTKAKAKKVLDLQDIYIADLKIQANQLFKTAMQSRKLNRAEILKIKDYLISNVDDPKLKNSRYKNEAHCIYSYLKSKYINENTLNCVIKNIFILSNKKAA